MLLDLCFGVLRGCKGISGWLSNGNLDVALLLLRRVDRKLKILVIWGG